MWWMGSAGYVYIIAGLYQLMIALRRTESLLSYSVETRIVLETSPRGLLEGEITSLQSTRLDTKNVE